MIHLGFRVIGERYKKANGNKRWWLERRGGRCEGSSTLNSLHVCMTDGRWVNLNMHELN
jgi:hypothetical protein